MAKPVFSSETLAEFPSRLTVVQGHHFGYNPVAFHFHIFIEKSKSGELESFHIDFPGASENCILYRTEEEPPRVVTDLTPEMA